MTSDERLDAYRPTTAQLDTDWTPSARAALRDRILAVERTDASGADPRVRADGRPRTRFGARLIGVAAAALVVGGAVAAVSAMTSSSPSAPQAAATTGTASAHGDGFQTFRLAGYRVSVPTWASPHGCLPGIPVRKLPSGQSAVKVPKLELGRAREYVSNLAFHPHSNSSCAVLSAQSTDVQPRNEHRIQVPGHAPLYVKSGDGIRSASYPFGGARPGWSTVSVSARNSQRVLTRIAVELRATHVLVHR